MKGDYGMPGVRVERIGVAEKTALSVAIAGAAEDPLVVLLHGFPECAYAWRRFVGPLAAAGFRVAAPDQRGYGYSDRPRGRRAYVLDTLADDVLAIARALDAPRFAVAGHDWGGVVTWQLALRDGERVDRALVLNAPCLGTVGPYARRHPRQLARSWYVGAVQVPLVPEWVLRRGDFAALRAAMVRTARPGTFSPDDLARYMEAWRQPGALTSMLAWYRALPLARARTRAIAIPVHVIWGDADAFLERHLAEEALRLCATGSVLHVPRATHWVHHEEPDAVLRSMLAFLAPFRATAPRAACRPSPGGGPARRPGIP